MLNIDLKDISLVVEIKIENQLIFCLIVKTNIKKIISFPHFYLKLFKL